MANKVVFRDNAEEVLSLLNSAKKKALFNIGAAAQGYAQDNTPVRTGSLAGSYTVEIDDAESAVRIGVPKDYTSPQGQKPGKYAIYVELGSRHNKAHHMIERAATEHNSEYKKLAKKAFENA